ncbi:unnamed protein product, partial [Vitis vinifera]|uniref:Uncharacterized protein n=1 Tax=Vitis vinifera TaxID=29760 RepID=E0CNU3_VITVI
MAPTAAMIILPRHSKSVNPASQAFAKTVFHANIVSGNCISSTCLLQGSEAALKQLQLHGSPTSEPLAGRFHRALELSCWSS